MQQDHSFKIGANNKSLEVSEQTEILDQTESLCPVCLQVIPAKITTGRDKAVYLQKTCPEHGLMTAYLWPDADHYRWMQAFRLREKSPQFSHPPLNGCPRDCGLCSAHLRRPTLVEIEVTQRCNLRCPVCFMEADQEDPTKLPDLDLNTIRQIFKGILEKSGPQTSIQITGGEPTTHHNLPEIIRMGKELGFSAIEINTNGVIAGRDFTYVRDLAEAGASGLFLQFDGLTGEIYQQTRGKDLLEIKLKAIEHCRQAGLQVVLAMTVIWGINHEQLGAVLNFALQNRDVIAGIAYQPAFTSGRFDVVRQRRLTMGDVAFLLAGQTNGLLNPYDLWPLGCSHPLCSCSTYIIEQDGKFEPFTRRLTEQEYREYFDCQSPQGSVLADIAARNKPELEPGLSIVIMNYMDAMTMDLRRLRECSMLVADQDGRWVPFCAYQLTNLNGKKLSELQPCKG